MDHKAKLDAYAREIGVGYMTPFSLDALIDSHRTLREWSAATAEEQRAERKKAYKDAYAQAMDSTWIKIDKLKTMTVIELANLLAEPGD